MRAALPKNMTLVTLVAALALVLLASALRHAIHYYNHPIGGMFVDPDGVVSSGGLPTWSGIRAGLRFPDRVVSVDGVRLDDPEAPGRYRASIFDEAVERARGEGRSTIHAKVTGPFGEKEIDLTVE